jgi:hypothetical protein
MNNTMPTARHPMLNTAGRLEPFDPSVLASRAKKLYPGKNGAAAI